MLSIWATIVLGQWDFFRNGGSSNLVLLEVFVESSNERKLNSRLIFKVSQRWMKEMGSSNSRHETQRNLHVNRCQFHQHHKLAFFVQNFGAKNYKAVFWVWSFGAKNFVQKMWCDAYNVDEIDTRLASMKSTRWILVTNQLANS